MSISSGTNKDTYNGDGSTYQWPISFSVTGLSADEIAVYTVSSAGVTTQLTSNYEVDLSVPRVTYPVSGDKLAEGEQIIILPELSIKQESDYTNQGGVPPTNLEADLDRIVRILKMQEEVLNRCIKVGLAEDEATSDALIAQIGTAVTAAETAQTAAETAETNAETAQTAAETAQAAAEAAQAALNLPDLTEGDSGKIIVVNSGEDGYDTSSLDSAGAVDKTSAQTIAGVKTFSSSPVVPETPTTDGQAASKGYVDACAPAATCLMKTGSYTGDGAEAKAITGVGFQPKYVRIWPHLSSTSCYEKLDQSWGAQSFTPDIPGFNENAGITSLDSDGFTVDDAAVDSHPNKDGQVYDYLTLGTR